MLLNNKWVNNEIKEEPSHLEIKINTQEPQWYTQWYTAKAILRGQFIALEAYLKKKKKKPKRQQQNPSNK